jgi:hypothetical protein
MIKVMVGLGKHVLLGMTCMLGLLSKVVVHTSNESPGNRDQVQPVIWELGS